MKTLKNAKINHQYTIAGYNGNDAILRRFLELGFSLGQKVKVVATSIQKKVFLIEIRGYVLSIRADLLDRILIN